MLKVLDHKILLFTKMSQNSKMLDLANISRRFMIHKYNINAESEYHITYLHKFYLEMKLQSIVLTYDLVV